MKIVDLAGSEKFKICPNISPEERLIRVQELTSINRSLSTLGQCISALQDKSRTHIPFRNSKLTRVLSDSLNGKSKITIIINISPSLSSQAETLSTLQVLPIHPLTSSSPTEPRKRSSTGATSNRTSACARDG